MYDAYVLCTSPRSGSTLLCQLLSATGVAGRPGSLFHEPALAAWLAYHDLNAADFPTERAALDAILAAAIARGRGGTDLFGLRLQRGSFAFLMQQLALVHPGPLSDRARIEAAFGRTLFIHLTRDDKLDQAISITRAEQTGLWHRAPDGTEIERLAPPQEPSYDAAAIRAHLDAMTEFDRDWLAWFRAEGIAPLRVTYDALAADPAGTLATLLAALGRDPARADAVVPEVAKLADATSADWRARFLADRA